MKKYKLNLTLAMFLFFLGIMVESLAFFVGHADHVPFVFRVISPTYYSANKGFEKLRDIKLLKPTDKGFVEISQLFKEIAVKQNSVDVIKKITPTEFTRKNAYQSFSTKRVKEVIKVEVKLSNGQVVDWDLNIISTMVKDLKSTNTFKIAMVIFAIGVFIQIISVVINTPKSIDN